MMALLQSRRARIVLNLLVFEAAWFACVIGAAQGRPGIGVAAVAAAVALHLGLSRMRSRDALLIGAALLIGLAWDSLLARAGLVDYASPGPLPGWAPPWILALWALFATVLREPLQWLHGHLWLATLLGAIGGPLSYAGAARLGAAQIPHFVQAMLALAVGWGLITPLLVALARRCAARNTALGAALP
jgi:hypothetical protein